MAKLISDLMPEVGKNLIDVKGVDILSVVGEDVIKNVVVSLLCGENIRNLTEPLTRRRLNIGNGALLALLLKAAQKPEFINKMPYIISSEIRKNKNKNNRIILQWLLGLTGKSVQNVLRSKEANVDRYIEATEKSLYESNTILTDELGDLDGEIGLKDDVIQLDWLFILRLFTAIGAQTLAIRGSEKSIYGKLFERLTLGSLLSILGFNLINPAKDTQSKTRVFWLSERGDKRESDATLLFEPGIGIRFDMGFIGPGNPEISLDKVSRFERHMEFGAEKHYMLTFIIVDRIGKKSRIIELAKEIDGTIIQMSMAYWPKLIAIEMNKRFRFKHKLLNIDNSNIRQYFEDQLSAISIKNFI